MKLKLASMTHALLIFLAAGMTAGVGFGEEVKTTPIAVKTVRVFKDLQVNRPILFTHAGDGSHRLFVASQYGEIFVIPKGESPEEPDLFIDMRKKVVYKDRQNEEGFLGLAFHPKFKENGQFFVYYTTKDAPHTSVISRMRVSKDNPNKADENYEEELMRIKQPFWNHNGGTICFGPDGMLYIGLGDGGAADDPAGNGQNLSTWLGSILRIDVDNKDEGKNYAIPKDNPFVNKKDAKPEIYAYGLRNVWRMSFDSKTGDFWVADVGQNLWEEINLVTKGGNYGWNSREAMHNFVRGKRNLAKGDDKPAEKVKGLIDPIWEYDHAIGKSITGGHVYRGDKVKELMGHYVFADYVSGFVWALKYDKESQKVVGHHRIEGAHYNPMEDDVAPVMTFGEAEDGTIYFSDSKNRVFSFQAN